MDRRPSYGGGNTFYGRNFPPTTTTANTTAPYFQSSHDLQKAAEEDLVARSKEWMNRQDKDKELWKRSVDDFLLEDKNMNNRYHKHRERSRSRSRSRSRTKSDSKERGDRKEKRRGSRDRERSSRGSSRDAEVHRERRRSPTDDENSREFRRYERSGSDRSGDRWSDERRSDRWPRRHDWSDERHESSSSRRWSREDDDRKGGGAWSSEDEGAEDPDFAHRPYVDASLRLEDRYSYKKQTPQRTIIIRGLAQHITEHDIQVAIALSKLTCRDIRLVRRKDTGTSRGFAFVEFCTVEDAKKWIEENNGELMLKENFRALLQYSLPKDHYRDKWLTDWYCKCQAHNFRRRDTCFKCNMSRVEAEVSDGMENDEVSAHPTNTVLLRGLDALTTEESVLQSIKTLSSLPIRSVRIGRDAATNTSKGVCYLDMNSVLDAMYLHDALRTSSLVIDGRTAIVSYAKLDPVTLYSSAAMSGKMANTAVAAAQWSHQKTESTTYKLSDVPRLAEFSATMYATTPQEKTAYYAYYEDYYRKQISAGAQISLPDNTSSGLATAQAALAAHQKSKDSPRSPLSEAPDGSGSKTYPVPEISSYQYDKSSGYYYDPYTTLYYDSNSQYYYNNKIGKFLYWDAKKKTYLPAPTDQINASISAAPSATGAFNDSATISKGPTVGTKEDEKKLKEKETEKDKVKVAKRIAKDMERWAKTLNQKKENAKQNIVTAAAAVSNFKAAGAADIGYAVLERKDLSIPMFVNNTLEVKGNKNESLVAAYGQGSESEEEAEDSSQEDKLHTDWVKLACLLCKRQFPSKEALIKHQQLSDLHKQNLSSWYKARGLDPDDAQKRNIQYRDRARERRMKYGEPDTPQPCKLKETYIKARQSTVNYEEPTKAGIKSDNLGNKLLQKMGWQEGMGLGKSNQGRTSIIQAERRSATAGLGTKSVGVTPGPGETYKDCVKKMMHIRYSEIEDRP
ncbi:RNA-binding protein 5-like [Rhodnius prolixus]